MCRAAEAPVNAGLAYVDEQSAEGMRMRRGDFCTPGTDSPFRSRAPAENLAERRAHGHSRSPAWSHLAICYKHAVRGCTVVPFAVASQSMTRSTR